MDSGCRHKPHGYLLGQGWSDTLLAVAGVRNASVPGQESGLEVRSWSMLAQQAWVAYRASPLLERC